MINFGTGRSSKQTLIFILITLLMLPTSLNADVYIDSEDCPSYIWDLTGSYEFSDSPDCGYSFVLNQDPKGKITGFAAQK